MLLVGCQVSTPVDLSPIQSEVDQLEADLSRLAGEMNNQVYVVTDSIGFLNLKVQKLNKELVATKKKVAVLRSTATLNKMAIQRLEKKLAHWERTGMVRKPNSGGQVTLHDDIPVEYDDIPVEYNWWWDAWNNKIDSASIQIIER